MRWGQRPVLPCAVLSCSLLSCPLLPYPLLSSPVLSCPDLSCPLLSCPLLSLGSAAQLDCQAVPFCSPFVTLFFLSLYTPSFPYFSILLSSILLPLHSSFFLLPSPTPLLFTTFLCVHSPLLSSPLSLPFPLLRLSGTWRSFNEVYHTHNPSFASPIALSGIAFETYQKEKIRIVNSNRKNSRRGKGPIESIHDFSSPFTWELPKKP